VEFPEFSEMWDDARRQSRASIEAFESAQTRAAGKSRDEITLTIS
jgi:hypothetical protein